MNSMYYQMIFKRKSFHFFKGIGKITETELNNIKELYLTLRPLCPQIKTEIRIVPHEETSCKRGQEYCILFYSERKEHYLQNIGYLGEQLDLHLARMNIGALWFGIGKVNELQYNGLDFVIMIAIAKLSQDQFRKDMFKSKRKPLSEIWHGNSYLEIGNITRFAPSACNIQPWIINTDENQLTLYRDKKPDKRGIMPKDKVTYYNRIDIGIYLWFLETCLDHHQISFDRTLYPDTEDDAEQTLTAIYHLKENHHERL